MKEKYAVAHMKVAHIYAQLSYCVRKQVGCVVVKEDRIISIGYNGTLAGTDNTCETESNQTKPEVYHAELNAISKLARSNESGEDASVFITLAPCLDCAMLLAAIKVKEVYYDAEYRGTAGIEFLEKNNIKVTKLTV